MISGLSFQALNEALKQVRADLVEATQNAVKVCTYSVYSCFNVVELIFCVHVWFSTKLLAMI